jgi:outer membrane protein assembly factor BamE (lipoprotein component of BamABCDE complex)
MSHITRTRIAGAALVALLGLTASGCSRTRDVKGYITDDQIMTMVQPGVDNRDSVMKTLGRPTVASNFDSKTWYYVSRQTQQWAFFYPQPKNQEVVIVRFDDKGNVSKVEKQGMDQIVSVDPTNDKTPTRGKEISALQQIFGNIGRYSPAGSGGGPQ